MNKNLTFREALKLNLRVIYALILRETRATFGTSSLGYLWAFITPIFGVGLLVLVFSFASRQPPFGQSLALFFATGFLPFEYYRKLSNSLLSVLDSNKSLLLYPVVFPISSILARFFLISITYIIIMGFFYFALICLELASYPANLVSLLNAFLLMSIFGFSIGMVNLCLYTVWNSWKNVWAIIQRPMFFISGVFFIPTFLPENILKLLSWNPVLHCIEFFRISYYSNYDSIILNTNYVLWLSLTLILIGMFLERVLRRI